MQQQVDLFARLSVDSVLEAFCESTSIDESWWVTKGRWIPPLLVLPASSCAGDAHRSALSRPISPRTSPKSSRACTRYSVLVTSPRCWWRSLRASEPMPQAAWCTRRMLASAILYMGAWVRSLLCSSRRSHCKPSSTPWDRRSCDTGVMTMRLRMLQQLMQLRQWWCRLADTMATIFTIEASPLTLSPHRQHLQRSIQFHPPIALQLQIWRSAVTGPLSTSLELTKAFLQIRLNLQGCACTRSAAHCSSITFTSSMKLARAQELYACFVTLPQFRYLELFWTQKKFSFHFDVDTRGQSELLNSHLELGNPRVPDRKELPSFTLYMFSFLLRRARSYSPVYRTLHLVGVLFLKNRRRFFRCVEGLQCCCRLKCRKCLNVSRPFSYTFILVETHQSLTGRYITILSMYSSTEINSGN